ncbi:ABC transporter permease [Salinigranum marinum]|uniref:ABC transporter permease n=1 Tax=Salinigranum marinum TaxID=1515595 RepID=UPI002989FDCC|nr:ABC transporter permease [Salinigranum marinum]
MSWQAVAQKDFEDAIRSRWLWGLSAFFLLFFGGTTTLFYAYVATGSDASSDALFGLFASGFLSFSYTGFLAFALAFIALITSYGAVVDERESGTLKLLLSLPHDRRDVVTGKIAGRSAVVVIPALVGFLIALVALLATGTRIVPEHFFPQVALTALLAVAFVSIGVGVSASADSGRQATLGTLGLYFLFALLWSFVARGFPQLLTEIAKRVPGMEPLSNALTVKLRLFVKYLNPLRAYETLVAEVYFGDPVQARLVKEGFFAQAQAAPVLQESLPVYLTGSFIFAVLLAWIVVPPLLGYWSFRDRDL